MKIGVPKEIKNHEYRVGLSPASARELIANGHEVTIATGAAAGIGLDDNAYTAIGAKIAASNEAIYADSEMIVKVKEPQPDECRQLRRGQLLFTYLHLAPDAEQTRLLLESGVTAVAYETVTGPGNSLPLLAPMSEVAGRLAAQAGAHCLERAQGGCGVLMGGVPGTEPAKVLVIGGGVVGQNAAYIARGMGANVTILDRSISKLRELDIEFQGKANCVYSTTESIERYAIESDLVIGAVLIPGANAPKLITREIISKMKPGSVVVDVAIDQGGCFETSKATTHQDPTFVVDGVVHYCVANMPGAVPQTSTYALNNATLPFTLAMANLGWKGAMQQNADLLHGLNVHDGKLTYQAVAAAQGLEYTDPATLIK
ncbi:alanine dehydrogenase [Arenicella xantha]|uniref:Alanine dehydrogenase n=1 Tax=Arenicella xantha TaxID=644221 RepID=A0A395JS84_9GAMM|nr:alanine dehydrogenase [Arenicella xantha]RBP53316.1 L-alanine dehydrogenase [Arenicella xantha]